MGDHAGDRPAHRRMLRRKRTAAIEKITSSVGGEGAVAARNILNRGGIKIGVDGRFPAQKSGLALVFILGERTPKIHAAAHSSQRRQPGIREVEAVDTVEGVLVTCASTAVSDATNPTARMLSGTASVHCRSLMRNGVVSSAF